MTRRSATHAEPWPDAALVLDGPFEGWVEEGDDDWVCLEPQSWILRTAAAKARECTDCGAPVGAECEGLSEEGYHSVRVWDSGGCHRDKPGGPSHETKVGREIVRVVGHWVEDVVQNEPAWWAHAAGGPFDKADWRKHYDGALALLGSRFTLAIGELASLYLTDARSVDAFTGRLKLKLVATSRHQKRLQVVLRWYIKTKGETLASGHLILRPSGEVQIDSVRVARSRVFENLLDIPEPVVATEPEVEMPRGNDPAEIETFLQRLRAAFQVFWDGPAS